MLSDLREFILDDSAVASLVGTRMYPVSLPQAVTYPALTYSQVSGVRQYDLCGPTGRTKPRVSISSWARNYADARALADAVRRALNGFVGTMGDSPGTTVNDAKIENEFDVFEEEADTKGVYRVMQDFILSHMED
jgi:hypothetical protein